jgi:hypothetical protein
VQGNLLETAHIHLTAPALNRRCAGDDHVHPD